LTVANAVTWISYPFQFSILCCLYAIPQIPTRSLLARHILSSDDIKCLLNLYHFVRPLKPRRRLATLLSGCVSRAESLTLSLFKVDDPNCIDARRLGCGSRDSTSGPASLGCYIANGQESLKCKSFSSVKNAGTVPNLCIYEIRHGLTKPGPSFYF
jgi:hypothetical protein